MNLPDTFRPKRWLPTMLVAHVVTSTVTVRVSVPSGAVHEIVRFVGRTAAWATWADRHLLAHRRPRSAAWARWIAAAEHVRDVPWTSFTLPPGEPYVDVRTSGVHIVVTEMPLSCRARPLLRWRST